MRFMHTQHTFPSIQTWNDIALFCRLCWTIQNQRHLLHPLPIIVKLKIIPFPLNIIFVRIFWFQLNSIEAAQMQCHSINIILSLLPSMPMEMSTGSSSSLPSTSFFFLVSCAYQVIGYENLTLFWSFLCRPNKNKSKVRERERTRDEKLTKSRRQWDDFCGTETNINK